MLAYYGYRILHIHNVFIVQAPGNICHTYKFNITKRNSKWDFTVYIILYNYSSKHWIKNSIIKKYLQAKNKTCVINFLIGCTPVPPQCDLQGRCVGNVLHVNEVQTAKECLNNCKATDGCRWFSFVPTNTSVMSSCILYHDCNTLDEDCQGCVSGERRCNDGKGE